MSPSSVTSVVIESDLMPWDSTRFLAASTSDVVRDVGTTVAPAAAKAFGDGKPDTSRPAGDDCDATREIELIYDTHYLTYCDSRPQWLGFSSRRVRKVVDKLDMSGDFERFQLRTTPLQ